MKTYHIYLLRHGMTTGNKEGRYIGRTDLPLCEEGIEELARLRESCRYPQADVFFTSPMRRCVETLELLYPENAPLTVPGLTECDFGVYEGKTMQELQGDEGYQRWVAGGGKTPPPGGESAVDFQKRCCAAFEGIVESLMRSGEDRAVIMAHGGTIMFILGTYGYPRKPFYSWMAGNGRGYELLLTPQLWMSGKALEIAGEIPEEAEGDGLSGLRGMAEENIRLMEEEEE